MGWGIICIHVIEFIYIIQRFDHANGYAMCRILSIPTRPLHPLRRKNKKEYFLFIIDRLVDTTIYPMNN